ncbi:MAG: MBG domain-containing protein [Bacteroidota bacterium]
MLRQATLTFLGLIMFGMVQGQWVESQLPIPSSVVIFDMDFEADDRGWAVGTEGYILFFDGHSWEVDTIITDNDFSTITFPRPNDGWATTVEGNIYRYNGNQWNLNFQTPGKNLFTLHFINDQEGFVSGTDGYLAYYDGTQWIEGNIGFDVLTLTSYFSDNKNGWLSSGHGELYQFKDSIWSLVNIPSSGAFNGMTFTRPDNGYGTGFSDDIWRYDGADWQVDYTGQNDQFTSLFFFDDNNGWAGGNGYIATYNNGIWSEEIVGSEWINAIHFTNPNTGWAMGAGGKLLSYSSPFSSLQWQPIVSIPGDIFVTDFATNTDGDTYAIGHTQDPFNRMADIFKSTDNGTNWSKIGSGFNEFVRTRSIEALGDVLIAAVNDENQLPLVIRSTDNGLTWNLAHTGIESITEVECMTSDGSGILYAIANKNQNNKTIPQLYQSLDTAQTWSVMNVSGFPAVDDANFITIDHTGSKFLLTYTNNVTNQRNLYTSADATTWERVDNLPTDFAILDIEVSGNTWFMVGTDITSLIGELYSSINEGASWQPMDTLGLEEHNSLLLALHAMDNQFLLSTNTGNQSEDYKVFSANTKLTQTITFNSLDARVYGNPSFAIGASASSGLPLTYSSSDNAVAEISNGIITINGAGTTTITVAQPGNEDYQAAQPVTQTLMIEKAALNASVQDVEREFGQSNPEFILQFEGFVNNDDVATLDVLPEAFTTANETSLPGEYEISISGGTDGNYTFSYTSGVLTIIPSTVTSLDELTLENISIYPNPIRDIVNVKFISPKTSAIIHVIDNKGVTIMTREVNHTEHIDLTNYPNGLYCIKVRMKNEVVVFNLLKL